jgi:hypothetical protein
MRSLPIFAGVVAASVLAAASPVSAAETATASAVVSAQFSSRTSLKVSTDLLHFEVAEPGQRATATVDFAAGARTQAGAEVLLSIEQLHAVQGPGGASDLESSVSFAGEGAGTLAGALIAAGPAVAGRWIGSGLRQGRLVFALRAGASGNYMLPVRFILSAP